MKRIQLTEIKNLDIKTLLARATDIKVELAKLQLERDLKDPKAKGKKRRDLAQILTVLRQKQLMEELRKEKP